MTALPSAQQGDLLTLQQEKEPMLLLDTTGSMQYGVSETDNTPRHTLVREAISIIVGRLAGEDSQAAHEAEGGGLRTVTFADGAAHDIEDLNPANLVEKWKQIRWRGGTQIMPGFKKLLEVYTEEFGSRPKTERPVLMALVITDGEADDTIEFHATVGRASGDLYVVLAVVGYGAEHDAALASYRAIEATNAHVKVVSFAAETNPETIAGTLLRMIA